MKTTVLCVLILLFTYCSQAQHNVILIIADDLGSDWCGFSEDHLDTVGLPHIRTLLSKGVRFQNAVSNPVCSPTRAGILTGRYSFRTGVGTIVSDDNNYGELDTAEVTIPRLLNIYNPNIAKGHIGKWHLNTPTPNTHYFYPNIFGYNHFEGSFIGSLPSYYNWTKVTNGIISNVTNYATVETADNAISWIKTTGNNPFFLWLAFNAPHLPYDLPPAGLYSDTTLSGTTTDIKANPKKYFKACLEALDHEIGRLFDSLQVMNKLDSTDIIFIGDNGNTSVVAQNTNPDHAKGTIFQYGAHVPCIISGPSVVNPGRVSSALINTVDLFSTIIELFGYNYWQTQIPLNKPVDSKSILPILKNTSSNIRPWAFIESFKILNSSNDKKSIRNMNYSLHNYSLSRQEIYDLATDPGEINNLLLQPLSTSADSNYNYLCSELTNLTGQATFCYSTPVVFIYTESPSFCSGKYVTFTATSLNTGPSPTYQWKINGLNVGTNSNIFGSSTFNNHDVITCVMTTLSQINVSSSAITLQVKTTVTPTITISTISSGICSGAPVTFNALTTNAGSSPIYKWKKNGIVTGSNSNSYTSSTLANGNTISCTLTSNVGCATTTTAVSNQIQMVVNKTVPLKPSTISGSINNLCNTSGNYTYNSSTVSNAISYFWIVPNYATIVSGQGTNNIVVNYSTLFKSGVIYVQATNYCGTSSQKSLYVYARTEKPGSISGPNTVCINQQNVPYSISTVPNATSYAWTVPAGGLITSGQGTTAIIANFSTNPGNVTVLAQNACANSVITNLPITINCRMANDKSIDDEFVLKLENPFHDDIYISLNSDINNVLISLQDLTGREICQWKNVSFVANNQQILPVNKTLSSGIFLLKIKNTKVNISSKINHQ